MLRRFAPLVPISFVVFLAACASHSLEVEIVPGETQAFIQQETISFSTKSLEKVTQGNRATPKQSAIPGLASSILERAFELLGTPYRYGGSSEAGFDCSGFVGYLFKHEAGIRLPRTTREMINMDVPMVSKKDLQPGDVLFFNNRGRGRVSHTGIYIGDGRFIHSASRRGGGVRVDSLDSTYWGLSYMEAKRLLGTMQASN